MISKLPQLKNELARLSRDMGNTDQFQLTQARDGIRKLINLFSDVTKELEDMQNDDFMNAKRKIRNLETEVENLKSQIRRLKQ